MKILTAGNKNFKPLILKSLEKIKEFNYESVVYDLGGLGFGKEFKVDKKDFNRPRIQPVPATFKPKIIKDCLSNMKKDRTLVYLDGDAFLMKNIDEIEYDNYDVGITVRTEHEVKKYKNYRPKGSINSGVIFLRNTKIAMEFIDTWINKALEENSDQVSLNSLLGDCVDVLKYDQTVRKDRLKVKLFRTTVYNNYYPNFDTDKTKIRHLKGSTMKKEFL